MPLSCQTHGADGELLTGDTSRRFGLGRGAPTTDKTASTRQEPVSPPVKQKSRGGVDGERFGGVNWIVRLLRNSYLNANCMPTPEQHRAKGLVGASTFWTTSNYRTLLVKRGASRQHLIPLHFNRSFQRLVTFGDRPTTKAMRAAHSVVLQN